LGVLYLALLNPKIGFDTSETRAFLAAVLIHDAATPPFAHLLEYYLRDLYGWDHEKVIPELLTGHHAPENIAHQILPGEAIRFQKLCKDCSIDFDLVLEIVGKRHRLSKLLFGSLDFDNLDNVFRMAWAMGVPAPISHCLSLARNIGLDLEGHLLLPRENLAAVEKWADLRKQAYNILVFDEPTVGAQAILTRAMRNVFEARQLDDIDWLQRDRDLLEFLSQEKITKNLMLRMKNEIPRMVLCVRISGSLIRLGMESRNDAVDWVEARAREHLKLLMSPKASIPDVLGYVFVDRGAFSKKLQFRDPTTGELWTTGETSQSVVLYCFLPGSATDTLVLRLRDALSREIHDGAPVS
jgi:HD superfamily phosphohydrolase